jgi:hypothetical protein
MPKDFYGHRTVTDYLIAKGVGFHPQTVILEATEIDNDPPKLYSEAMDGRIRPPFDYQTIEMVQDNDEYGKAGRLIYVTWHPDQQEMQLVSFRITREFNIVSPQMWRVPLDADGNMDTSKKISQAPGQDFYLPIEFMPRLEKEDMQWDTIFAMLVFNCIHEKFEIDEVEFPRQARRLTERKTGKKPSNYYSIRNIKRQRKQYPVSDSTSSAGSSRAKSEAHLVRGHFLTQPDNHPLPQFAGKTFWVPAHQRGAGTNEKKIIYRVEL